MLCNGGGEGSSVSIPFSALGAHTVSFIKNLYNIKVYHHTAQNFQSPGPTKDPSHRKLGKISWVLCLPLGPPGGAVSSNMALN